MTKTIDRLRAWTRHSVVAASLGLALLGLSAPISNVAAQETQTPNIAAASDLKFALEEIAASFESENGTEGPVDLWFVWKLPAADPARGAVPDVPLG